MNTVDKNCLLTPSPSWANICSAVGRLVDQGLELPGTSFYTSIFPFYLIFNDIKMLYLIHIARKTRWTLVRWLSSASYMRKLPSDLFSICWIPLPTFYSASCHKDQFYLNCEKLKKMKMFLFFKSKAHRIAYRIWPAFVLTDPSNPWLSDDTTPLIEAR